MVIDRFGNTIQVAWADHELLLMDAALALQGEERNEAFKDIASMSGRTVGAVRAYAQIVLYRRRMESYYAGIARSRKFIAEREERIKVARELRLTNDVSKLRQPSAQEKMTGRIARQPR